MCNAFMIIKNTTALLLKVVKLKSTRTIFACAQKLTGTSRIYRSKPQIEQKIKTEKKLRVDC